MDRPRVSVVDGGVERVPLHSGACWICKKTAVAGERLPGKRHKTRPLCGYHADLVFRPGSLTEPHAEDDGSAADGTRVRLPALPRVTSATRRASRNSRCHVIFCMKAAHSAPPQVPAAAPAVTSAAV